MLPWCRFVENLEKIQFIYLFIFVMGATSHNFTVQSFVLRDYLNYCTLLDPLALSGLIRLDCICSFLCNSENFLVS